MYSHHNIHAMPTRPFLHKLHIVMATTLLVLLVLPCVARGEEGDETLNLFNAWQEESSTASRAPKPLSKTAENITIITAADIEALNAHTLNDVLNSVSGVQIWGVSGPGNVAFTFVQGAQSSHVLVMVDGIPLNTLGENFSDTDLVPARIIERIEIVKGAASSAWGQALGGVINVITKTPDRERRLSGVVTASIGDRTTADASAELSGTTGKLGYFLSSGYLGTNGLRSGFATSSNNSYAKLNYELPGRGQLWGTFNYTAANRVTFFSPDYNEKDEQHAPSIYASVGYRRSLSERLELEMTARHAYRGFDTTMYQISDGAVIPPLYITREKVYGGSAKLVWRGENNLVVAGGDYEHAELSATAALNNFDVLTRSVDRWGST